MKVTSEGVTHTQPTTSQLQPDPIKTLLDQYIEGKTVLVFSGYSGLGYNDKKGLELKLSQLLESAAQENGAHNLLVVAGATPEGIGKVYEVARRMNIETLGIVSNQASPDSYSPHCQHVVSIEDPSASWKVLDSDGKSYMTYAAQDGIFIALGGGAVTLSELTEAMGEGTQTYICSEFEPDKEKAAARLSSRPHEDLTPVRTAHRGDLAEADNSKPSGYSRRREPQVVNDRWINALNITLPLENPHAQETRKYVKHVHFESSVQYSEPVDYDRKNTEKLDIFNRAFRSDVDSMAKKDGFTWAEGHDNPFQDYPYSRERANQAAKEG